MIASRSSNYIKLAASRAPRAAAVRPLATLTPLRSLSQAAASSRPTLSTPLKSASALGKMHMSGTHYGESAVRPEPDQVLKGSYWGADDAPLVLTFQLQTSRTMSMTLPSPPNLLSRLPAYVSSTLWDVVWRDCASTRAAGSWVRWSLELLSRMVSSQ